MGKYEDRILMKHCKKYSRDETVAKLIGVLRQLKREIGFLTSERDEALYNLNIKYKENKTLREDKKLLKKDVKLLLKEIKSIKQNDN